MKSIRTFFYYLLFFSFVQIGAQGKISIIQQENFKRKIALCLDGVKDYISVKIDEAKVIEEPFPHIIVEEILPVHLYKEILKHWPKRDVFFHKGYKIRGRIRTTHREETAFSNKNDQLFWDLFGEVVVNYYIKPAIVKKLLPYFYLKEGMEEIDLKEMRDNLSDYILPSSFKDSLIQDEEGYFIRPHVDQIGMFAQMLIYFARPGDDVRGLGTVFYKGDRAKMDSLDKAIYIDVKNLTRYKKVPYRPNQLVAFLQCPFAWHGVDRTKSGQVRRLYLCPISMRPEFINEHYCDFNLISYYFFMQTLLVNH